jgi:muramoyltetrapeptide carboxypeptidase
MEKGDLVEIIVPASGCSREEYDAALEFVGKFGFTPRARPYDDVVKPGLCSNTAEYRFLHLMEALEAKDSKAVWCLKGGYGSQQMLEMLDEVEDAPNEKIFIGFSDITILLNYFADKWGWKCFHGPMPGQFGKIADSSWKNLADLVFGNISEVQFQAVALNNVAREKRNIAAKFMGGCLSLMQALVGTSHMPDLELSVLLLEDDRFETPRRVDRILNHMQRAGVFDNLEGVVLGNFLEGARSGSKDGLELQEVLGDLAGYLNERGIPLIQNIKLGHAEDMLTVPIGGVVDIKLGEKPEVLIRV